MLCNDCQNLDWDKKRMNYWTKVCDCHILVEIQQQEANRSDIQPSEKFNSERIDIESTKKSTLPPFKSYVPKMFWQEETKNSKFQPSEKFNSEGIDIESTKKSTLPPSKICLPEMSWLSILGVVVFSSCLMVCFFGLAIHNIYSTETSADDFGSKYVVIDI